MDSKKPLGRGDKNGCSLTTSGQAARTYRMGRELDAITGESIMGMKTPMYAREKS